MKKRIIIVVILLVFIGGLSYFIYSFSKDNKEVKKNIDIINKDYEEFYTLSMDIDNVRGEYAKIIADSYYETLNDNSDKISELLNKYKDNINKIRKTEKELSKLCKIYYSINNVEQKCNSYKVTYKTINDYYKQDIDGYNSLVDKYNENKEENKLEKFVG